MKTTRPLWSNALIVLSLLIAGVICYDVWRDLFVKSHTWNLIFTETFPLLVLDGCLFGLGWRCRQRGNSQIARQTLLGIVGALTLVVAVGGFGYILQSLRGTIKPQILAYHIGLSVALIGAGVGFYSGRQQKLKKKYKQERRQFAALFENTSDAIIEVYFEADEPVVEAVNPGFEETFGYDADEIVGESARSLAPSGKADEVEKHIERMLAGEQLDVTVSRKIADGTEKTFRGRQSPSKRSARR